MDMRDQWVYISPGRDRKFDQIENQEIDTGPQSQRTIHERWQRQGIVKRNWQRTWNLSSQVIRIVQSYHRNRDTLCLNEEVPDSGAQTQEIAIANKTRQRILPVRQRRRKKKKKRNWQAICRQAPEIRTGSSLPKALLKCQHFSSNHRACPEIKNKNRTFGKRTRQTATRKNFVKQTKHSTKRRDEGIRKRQQSLPVAASTIGRPAGSVTGLV